MLSSSRHPFKYILVQLLQTNLPTLQSTFNTFVPNAGSCRDKDGLTSFAPTAMSEGSALGKSRIGPEPIDQDRRFLSYDLEINILWICLIVCACYSNVHFLKITAARPFNMTGVAEAVIVVYVLSHYTSGRFRKYPLPLSLFPEHDPFEGELVMLISYPYRPNTVNPAFVCPELHATLEPKTQCVYASFTCYERSTTRSPNSPS